LAVTSEFLAAPAKKALEQLDGTAVVRIGMGKTDDDFAFKGFADQMAEIDRFDPGLISQNFPIAPGRLPLHGGAYRKMFEVELSRGIVSDFQAESGWHWLSDLFHGVAITQFFKPTENAILIGWGKVSEEVVGTDFGRCVHM
jgi:hypothetical protein